MSDVWGRIAGRGIPTLSRVQDETVSFVETACPTLVLVVHNDEPLRVKGIEKRATQHSIRF